MDCNNNKCNRGLPAKNNLWQNVKIRQLILSLLVIIPFEALSLNSYHLSSWIEFPIFATLVFIFGRKVFVSGLKSLLALKFSNINLLMSVAVFGAIYLKSFEEAAIIVVLFALGEALEDFGIEKSKSALKALVEETPKSALIKGNTQKTPIDDISVGDIVIIKPGDKIPLDGKIVLGSSLVDEAMITGEPLPKSKHENDAVFAGTINGNGYIEIQVTKKAKDSTLSKILDLTYKSAEKKSRSQKFIDIFAKYYTPFILFVAVFLVLIPVVVFKKEFNIWFTQALTLLIISCPCALVISTPVAIFSAIGNATKRGIIVKGGRFIEEFAKIKAVAFDKTRTLTVGEPVVSDIVPFNGFSREELMACASGLEYFSEHPLAKSIVKETEKLQIEPHGFTNFESIAGKGATGECLICSDKFHCIGNIKFVSQEHEVKKEVLDQIENFESQGKTTIIMSNHKIVKGVIGVMDEIRKESTPAIRRLLSLGITPVILTGDNIASARFVASQVGINKVKAELLPEEKLSELKSLIGEYKHVAMVGDGVNDVPSLATASVGVAMGAIGSDAAIENADVALMNNNLVLIPYMVALGKRTVLTTQFNIGLALITKFIVLFLAISGKSNLAFAIFADVGVTLVVVLNSLRLFRFDKDVF